MKLTFLGFSEYGDQRIKLDCDRTKSIKIYSIEAQTDEPSDQCLTSGKRSSEHSNAPR